MYIVQRRNSEASQWKTCSLNNKKCRYEYLPEARIAFRKIKNSPESQKYPGRQLRILDSESNKEVI